jgi:DNA-binding winged helix-turn-helix (wHTH) protein/TolB-like protein
MGRASGKHEEEMSTPSSTSRRLAVGALAFDPASGELTGPAGVERIAPQPASLLALLASRPGELVTREEIREHLWPGGKVEFEQGIGFAVREIRRAIGSAGGDASLVETIPKRGFRLAAASPLATDRSRPPSMTPPGRRLIGLAALGVVVVIALGFALTRGPAVSPVVVVFQHDTEDEDHAALARAVGFELTTALTRAFGDRLGVVGPTGSATLAGPDDTGGARASLGACLVVSGGMRPLGADSVVVFTQVVRTLDRVHAWAEQDTVSLAAAAAFVPRVVEGVESSAIAC